MSPDHNSAGWALLTATDRDGAKLTRAIEHFEAALREDPDHGPATANLLDALLAAGREREAVERAGSMILLGAGSHSLSRSHNWLGWYYSNVQNDLERALPHLESATTCGGWWGVAHLNHGMALESAGNPERALEAYSHALMSGDSHDPALAHARCGAIQYRRGWLRHALSSTRRAIVREERDPRGRLESWRLDQARIQTELADARLEFPAEHTERTWIELELAQGREGLGVDRRKKLSRDEREWREYEDRCAEDVPASGELGPLTELLRARDFDRALEELARLRAVDGNLILSAIGLSESYGEQALASGQREAGLALLEYAFEGYSLHAAGASSGGEGMERMLDVNRLRDRLSHLRAAAG